MVLRSKLCTTRVPISLDGKKVARYEPKLLVTRTAYPLAPYHLASGVADRALCNATRNTNRHLALTALGYGSGRHATPIAVPLIQKIHRLVVGVAKLAGARVLKKLERGNVRLRLNR
jgi:hypothetical protein